MVRNAAIVAGNSGERALAAPLAALLEDEAPVVRGAAVWALDRLGALEPYAARAGAETDESMREEWAAALMARLSGG